MFWRASHSFQQTPQISDPMRRPSSFWKGRKAMPSRVSPQRTHFTFSAIEHSP
jgi:hypothetical protein